MGIGCPNEMAPLGCFLGIQDTFFLIVDGVVLFRPRDPPEAADRLDAYVRRRPGTFGSL